MSLLLQRVELILHYIAVIFQFNSLLNNNTNNSVQFIYLRTWQKPDKADYSQALKQQYRIKYNILKNTSALQMKN
jgi:hypothetical protein